ncbi:hypothetical protein EFL59_11095 [Weissella confusa]|nr:hypothetical protein [Weissella confusa]
MVHSIRIAIFYFLTVDVNPIHTRTSWLLSFWGELGWCGAPAVLAGVSSEERETKDDLVRVSFEPTGDETRQDLGRLDSRRHQLIQQDGTPPRLAPKRFVREHDTQTKTKKHSPQTRQVLLIVITK